jgi:hypothetical protein
MQVNIMTIERDYVLAYISKLVEQYGSYFRTDIFNLAEELGVTWHGLRKKLNEWFKIDADILLFIPA